MLPTQNKPVLALLIHDIPLRNIVESLNKQPLIPLSMLDPLICHPSLRVLLNIDWWGGGGKGNVEGERL